MKETFGLINAKNAKPPNPKPSPKDFVWPSQGDHDDAVAKKIAASLQELLPKREWKHTHLAAALYGTLGPTEAPKNVGATRRWVVAEHPIPNEDAAGYIAQVLDVSMARLLEPEGKFSAFPPFIRGRSDSKRFPFKGKKAKVAKTPGGRDREKQRAYNAAYRERQLAKKGKRAYTKRVQSNGSGEIREDGAWVLADGVEPPTYTISSSEEHAGHVELEMKGVLPHARAMAILHILQHAAPEE